jgi:hypothetical protein
MLGRRRHERFTILQPWDGALRLLRDVAVHREGDGTLTVVGQAPGVVGELMTLDVSGAGANARLKVKVLDSRPHLLEGALRHVVRLAPVDDERMAHDASA